MNIELTRIDRKHHCNRQVIERWYWIYEKRRTDDILKSSINWHQIGVQTWPKSSRSKRICDWIHRYNNPAKHCDDHVLQCIVGIFYNGMLAVECNGDILGTYYWFLSLQNHMDPSPSQKNPHFHLLLQPANVFDLHHVYYQFHPILERRNYQSLFAASTEMKQIKKRITRVNWTR